MGAVSVAGDGARGARTCLPAVSAAGDRLVIMQWMIDELGLSGAQLLVYALVYRAGPGGLSASQKQIAYRCGISDSQTRRALGQLKGRGAIEQAVPETFRKPAVWVATPASAGSHWTIS